MTDDEVFYRENEIEITNREFRTIQNYNCVGDMIITLNGRHLENKFDELYKNQYFYTFCPAQTQLIQAFPLEMVKDSFSHFKLTKYKFIFFPISDFNVVTQSASHWSMVYIDNREGKMQLKHFDSNHHNNYDIALKFVSIISKVFDLQSTSLEELSCANQNNCYDCGVYVMAYREALIEARGDHEAANRILNPSYVDKYRENLRNTIIRLRKEKEGK